MDIRICIASPEDAEELLKIYAPYVLHTAVSFEYDVPSVEEFRRRIVFTLQKYPYLKAVSQGRIVGYAYAGPFHSRAAYAWGVESSVYVREDIRRKGVGERLYQALEKALRLQNILNINACIATPVQEDEYLNRNSVLFHQRMGYRMVGEFYRCGYKFGRWYNMVWMEKHLSEHPDEPAPVKRFPEIQREFEKML
ncbi:MAG: GNAT family N-acetyltransferase [Clostridiales bacterium]|nr:GNAT family N-acetyltransferase [Clostridiales bacterium]